MPVGETESRGGDSDVGLIFYAQQQLLL